MFKFLKKFRIIITILSIILFALFFGEFVPMSWKSAAFTVSNTLRKILMFLLPFLIFPFMVTSIASMKTRGAYLVGGILFLVLASNFTSIMIPYFVGNLTIPFLGVSQVENLKNMEELKPLFDFTLNPLLQMEVAMGIALLCGLSIGISGYNKLDRFLEKYTAFSRGFFEKIFIPTLPLYVLGTILKISHETDFSALLPIFGTMILSILATQLSYITFLYYIGSGCRISKTFEAMKNSFQASLVGFSTMSSVVTMPVTMEAAEKNIKDPTIARVAISTTVNCHDVGECISLPMIALTIYYLVNGIFPDLGTYAYFAFFVALAQFSGVAVPGGSIVLILPFLTGLLGFSDEMCSLIIALSIFLDPIGTANNVLGNGAFAMIVYRIYAMASRVKLRFKGPSEIQAEQSAKI